ncbi:MAG: hypothetical protein HN985_11695 [Planctomycetaceae bacterium]|nr:hypothetical protein [Planctomycetaceae bacterium]MBT6920375.1 hypothetical protein [Planctomycetaceae bacterium]MBT7728338.1 hypothetical protein [Planctomycetaceae bacterium]
MKCRFDFQLAVARSIDQSDCRVRRMAMLSKKSAVWRMLRSNFLVSSVSFG